MKNAILISLLSLLLLGVSNPSSGSISSSPISTMHRYATATLDDSSPKSEFCSFMSPVGSAALIGDQKGEDGETYTEVFIDWVGQPLVVESYRDHLEAYMKWDESYRAMLTHCGRMGWQVFQVERNRETKTIYHLRLTY